VADDEGVGVALHHRLQLFNQIHHLVHTSEEGSIAVVISVLTKKFVIDNAVADGLEQMKELIEKAVVIGVECSEVLESVVDLQGCFQGLNHAVEDPISALSGVLHLFTS